MPDLLSVLRNGVRMPCSEFAACGRRSLSNAGFARKYPVFRIQDSECRFSCFLFMLLQPKRLTPISNKGSQKPEAVKNYRGQGYHDTLSVSLGTFWATGCRPYSLYRGSSRIIRNTSAQSPKITGIYSLSGIWTLSEFGNSFIACLQ